MDYLVLVNKKIEFKEEMLGELVIAEVCENGQKLYLEKVTKEAFDKLMVDYNKNFNFKKLIIDSAF